MIVALKRRRVRKIIIKLNMEQMKMKLIYLSKKWKNKMIYVNKIELKKLLFV